MNWWLIHWLIHTKIVAAYPALPFWFILPWLQPCEAGSVGSIISILCLRELRLGKASEFPSLLSFER